MMKTKPFLTLIALFIAVYFSAQIKSLRELLAISDIVLVADRIPDPLFPKEKKIAFSDHKSMVVVDSVKINYYLRKPQNTPKSKKFLINNSLNNSFFGLLQRPKVAIPPIRYNEKPPVLKSIVFVKTESKFNEVLYIIDIEESSIQYLKDFIKWSDGVDSQKDEAKKCRLYIEKYLNTLEKNKLFDDFENFDNILLPNSDFMLYYKAKTPEATQLTEAQKQRLKDYLFSNDSFEDLETVKLVYDFYPEETINFYKEKLSNIRTYDDDFNDKISSYRQFLEFVLEKTNKLDKDAELLLSLLADYYNSNSTSNNRDIFARLVEKMNGN